MAATGYAPTAADAQRTLHYSYPGVAAQVRRARRDVASVLDGCPAADVVELCACEVITNAVLHSRSGLPGGHFTVDVTIVASGRVEVRVTDDGGPWRAVTRRDDDGDACGRGLGIVAALTTSMGISTEVGARTVWFICAWSAS
ncbi:MAG TPA: ATP-binding protein [Streptosporangiaceae bacterium]|nr:ATP-binding protein [Streptosporangiaceae bacterium]